MLAVGSSGELQSVAGAHNLGDARAKKNKAESLVVQVSRDLFPGCPGAANKARLRSYPPKTLTAKWALSRGKCLFSELYLA